MPIEDVQSQIQASIDVKASMLGNEALIQQVYELADKCSQVLRKGGKVIFCGNGGSFADAQHLSAEFTSRFLFDRPGLPSLALGTNSSAMTAIGNDYGYEYVFAREIQAIATSSDIIIAITTSGNSRNIIEALKTARDAHIPAVVLTGVGRGMLDETLVLFTTEFGRTPFAQSDKGKVGPGRDHNKGGFSIWMAGAGLRPGIAHGVTDEIGWKATENPTTWHDFHATVMHLLGMNHEALTFYHNGIERRLTNVHGNVIGEILA